MQTQRSTKEGRRGLRHHALGAAVLGCLLTVTACSPAEVEPPEPGGPSTQTVVDDEPQLLIDFNGVDLEAPSFRARTGQTVTVVGVDGGEIERVPGRAIGSAVRFPSGFDAEQGALVALSVTDEDRSLVPGGNDFALGADIKLTEEPHRTARDDGDNILQRGLFGSGGQYKLQLDDGRPSCRVLGDVGEALVKLPKRLKPDRWYRLRCERTAQRVTIFAARLPVDDDTTWDSATTWAITGEVNTVAPISIGAKVNIREELVQPAPDQFNGILDNVRVKIDGKSAG